MTLPEKPFSRKEQYLAKIAGEDVEIPEEPFSREEMYLEAIAEGGGGGGTSNFNQLTNRPKLNGTEMDGDTDIKNFTSSAQGLVPAPAAGDTDKYLKSDGTWSEVDYAKEASVIRTSTTQSQTASFIYRTTAGDMSIDTGEATLASIKGNVVMEGYHDEVKGYETNFADPNTTASIDWDTFITWINGKSWVDYSPFTLTWTGTPGIEWSISNSAGGSTSDSSANLGITVTGNVAVNDTITITYSAAAVGTITVALPSEFVATGYNQYNGVEGYAKVIGDNQYRIAGTADYWEFSPADGSTSVVITLDNGKYTPPTDGVLVPSNPSGDILVALVWSGIRDNDPYEPYETSTITIPTVDGNGTTLPTGEYGMPKVGDVADELNFSERIYIKRIGQYDYSEANLETVQAMGVDYIFDLTNIFYVLETPVTYTLASTVSGVYTANDFGTEEFTGSDVPLEATIIYGNNLVDKLRNLADIQTIGNNLTLIDGMLSAAGGGATNFRTLTDDDLSGNYYNAHDLPTGVYVIPKTNPNHSVRIGSKTYSGDNQLMVVSKLAYSMQVLFFGGTTYGTILTNMSTSGAEYNRSKLATEYYVDNLVGVKIDSFTTKDWPTSSPDGVALWKLPGDANRYYFLPNSQLKIYITPNHSFTGNINGDIRLVKTGGATADYDLLVSFDLAIWESTGGDAMYGVKGYGVTAVRTDTEKDYKTYTAS